MILIFKIDIISSLDDSIRSVFCACDSKDDDAQYYLLNRPNFVVNLNLHNYERVLSCYAINNDIKVVDSIGSFDESIIKY